MVATPATSAPPLPPPPPPLPAAQWLLRLPRPPSDSCHHHPAPTLKGLTVGEIRSLSSQSRVSTTASAQDRQLLGEYLRHTGSKRHAASPDIDAVVWRLLSFDGCEELLRGMGLNALMSRQAHVLRSSSVGSPLLFPLSKPTTQLHSFISHNWSLPRWQKYFCLMHHFNFNAALGFTCLVLVFLLALSVSGHLPTYDFDGYDYPRSVVFGLVLAPIFLLALMFCRDVAYLFGPGAMVFVDVTCINQTDIKQQRVGIQSLGAFLCHSNEMVVCLSPLYLRKLWTMFEVGSFLALHPVDRLKVVPTQAPLFFLWIIFMSWVKHLMQYLLELVGGGRWALVVMVICMVFLPFAGRHVVRAKVEIQQELSRFTVRNATCQVETDRQLIYESIRHLMIAALGLSKTTTRDQALDKFDDFVRSNVPSAILLSVGKYGLHYRHIILSGACVCFPAFLDSLAGIPHGLPLRQVLTLSLWYTSVVFLSGPLLVFFLYHWSRMCLHHKGVEDILHCFLGYFVVVLPLIAVFNVGMAWVEFLSQTSDVVLGVWIGALLLLIPVVAAVISERSRKRSRGHPEPAQNRTSRLGGLNEDTIVPEIYSSVDGETCFSRFDSHFDEAQWMSCSVSAPQTLLERSREFPGADGDGTDAAEREAEPEDASYRGQEQNDDDIDDDAGALEVFASATLRDIDLVLDSVDVDEVADTACVGVLPENHSDHIGQSSLSGSDDTFSM